jgi:CheY-like chemotaxis protein
MMEVLLGSLPRSPLPLPVDRRVEGGETKSPVRPLGEREGSSDPDGVDTDPVRVLIVDDHEGFRSSMVQALTLIPDVEVAGEACSGDEACLAAITLKPDLVLLDLSMPGMSPMDAARAIRDSNPESQVVVLSALEDPAVEEEAVAAGALGLIPKGTPLEDMVGVLREATGHRPSRGS